MKFVIAAILEVTVFAYDVESKANYVVMSLSVYGPSDLPLLVVMLNLILYL